MLQLFALASAQREGDNDKDPMPEAGYDDTSLRKRKRDEEEMELEEAVPSTSAGAGGDAAKRIKRHNNRIPGQKIEIPCPPPSPVVYDQQRPDVANAGGTGPQSIVVNNGRFNMLVHVQGAPDVVQGTLRQSLPRQEPEGAPQPLSQNVEGLLEWVNGEAHFNGQAQLHGLAQAPSGELNASDTYDSGVCFQEDIDME